MIFTLNSEGNPITSLLGLPFHIIKSQYEKIMDKREKLKDGKPT